jgi:hypothetical protein
MALSMKQEPAMLNLKQALGVALVMGATVLTLPAAALPLGGVAAGVERADLRDGQPDARIEQARWVCGPYRCFWRPNYWGGGPGWRGPGWRGPGWGGRGYGGPGYGGRGYGWGGGRW